MFSRILEVQEGGGYLNDMHNRQALVTIYPANLGIHHGDTSNEKGMAHVPFTADVFRWLLTKNLNRTVNPTFSPSPAPSPTSGGRSDWQMCADSSECINHCCSKQYSNDGQSKCTPGGSQCISGGSSGSKGDWQMCITSSECKNKCCSKRYSGDGRYKCTPGSQQCI
ncbi:hypothetical protein PROFUN_12700 [Planoprotostelium fungivorum]|uniref:Uncharacterized protein n=1 Tax=Planoprotostelium fungivorum TaxID=1890364 RepID=A0A2P6N6Y2_9EUKA|nr:hypothetical protein PROFUN_12700 [Planoprotostelium fungivorum]